MVLLPTLPSYRPWFGSLTGCLCCCSWLWPFGFLCACAASLVSWPGVWSSGWFSASAGRSGGFGGRLWIWLHVLLARIVVNQFSPSLAIHYSPFIFLRIIPVVHELVGDVVTFLFDKLRSLRGCCDVGHVNGEASG